MEAILFNQKGKEAGKISLNDDVFAAEYNQSIIHEVVVAQLANARQGTKSALTRAEVRGGGIKPYRQKGTGRARQGSIRSPQFVKGGVVFAPKPRDFSKKVNKKVKRSAFKSALSRKVADSEVIFIDDIKLTDYKTREVSAVLKAFSNVINVEKSILLVLPEYNERFAIASRNIPNLTTTYADVLSVYDLVSHAKCIMHKGAADKLGESYAEQE